MLRTSEVRELTGLSMVEIDRLEHAGEFPRRMCGARDRRGDIHYQWVREEVVEWLRNQIK